VKAPQRTWYQLRWQREVDPAWLDQAVRLLTTIAGGPVTLEAVGHPGAVLHRIALPAGRAENVVAQLRSVLPGVAIEALPERRPVMANRAVELRLTTKRRALRTDEIASVSSALLTALSDLKPGEVLTLQWALGRQLRPIAVPNKLDKVPRRLVAERAGPCPTRETDPRGQRSALGTPHQAVRAGVARCRSHRRQSRNPPAASASSSARSWEPSVAPKPLGWLTGSVRCTRARSGTLGCLGGCHYA
jgi:hypothetical protein